MTIENSIKSLSPEETVRNICKEIGVKIAESHIPTTTELLARVLPIFQVSSYTKFEPKATDLSPVKPKQKEKKEK